MDRGSWIEPYETNYIEMATGQRWACILKAKSKEELEATGQLAYVLPHSTFISCAGVNEKVAQVVDYKNFPAVGGPIFEPSAPLGRPRTQPPRSRRLDLLHLLPSRS